MTTREKINQRVKEKILNRVESIAKATAVKKLQELGNRNEEGHLEGVLDAITSPQLESLSIRKQPDARHLRSVFEQPNVVGIGIAEKISEGKNLGKLSVTFYVEKKIPLSELPQSSVIPPEVPAALAGSNEVLTDVVELGKLVLNTGGPFVQKTPVQPGNSVGHFKATAGTVGAIVRRGGKKMILSNSHVLALSGKAKRGDDILYPGKADGGKVPGDVVARLAHDIKFVTGGQFVNEVDCALAEIDPRVARAIDSSIRVLGGPSGVTVPKRGMRVRISGRTSGVSIQTEIKDTHFRFQIQYPELGSQVGFKNQILCRPPYSADGDSGSLVVEGSSGRAVGLHFAGASNGSVFNPIKKVLSKLGCTLELAGTAKPGKKAKKKRRKT